MQAPAKIRKPTALVVKRRGTVSRRAEELRAAGWDVTERDIEDRIHGAEAAQMIIDDVMIDG